MIFTFFILTFLGHPVALNIVYVFAIVCICYVSFELNNFHGYNIITSVFDNVSDELRFCGTKIQSPMIIAQMM